MIAQRVLRRSKMLHSGLWSPPLITLEFSLLLLLSAELSLCPPCSIFNLNTFSNVNKFSIFGYLCDIFFKRDVKKILGSIVSFFKKCTSNNRCLVGKKFKNYAAKIKDEKELNLWHKLWFSNLHTYETCRFKHLIFLNLDCYRIHSLKYLRATTMSWQCIGIRKSEFVTKTRSLCLKK